MQTILKRYCLINSKIHVKDNQRAAAGISTLVAAGWIEPVRDAKCPCKGLLQVRKALCV